MPFPTIDPFTDDWIQEKGVLTHHEPACYWIAWDSSNRDSDRPKMIGLAGWGQTETEALINLRRKMHLSPEDYEAV